MSKAVEYYRQAVTGLSEAAKSADATEAERVRAAIERAEPLIRELQALVDAGAPLRLSLAGWIKVPPARNLAYELTCTAKPNEPTFKTLELPSFTDDTRVFLKDGTAGAQAHAAAGYCLVASERRDQLGTLDDLLRDIAAWLARGR